MTAATLAKRRRLASPAADDREEPSAIFLADWTDVVLIHYALPAPALQPRVPLELDLYDGHAFVSLVAFTQRNLRPWVGGRLAEILSRPVAQHEFLNLRTYVRDGHERGIYFIAEWVPRRLAVLVARPLYGLPYRLGRLDYSSDVQRGLSSATVRAGNARFAFEATFDPRSYAPSAPGSIDEFLLERYFGFTARNQICRRFQIWHAPWLQTAARIEIRQTSLIDSTAIIPTGQLPLAAGYSPGLRDVRIGPPRRLNPRLNPRLPHRPPPAAPHHASSLRPAWLAWLPLALLPALALGLRRSIAPWAFMWLLALALYAGCKWLTWWRSARGKSVARSLGYLLTYPGMDAAKFLDGQKPPSPPPPAHWALACASTALGLALFWAVAPYLVAHRPLLAGWVAMIAIALTLHFGLFHLLALAWQKAGVDAPPLMNAPFRSASLAQFWAERWNAGFHRLAQDLIFAPIARRLGTHWALFAAFFVSGVVHDLVISLPARGGYGLPTLYFLLQAIGLKIERSRIGRSLGLKRGYRGRIFAIAFTLAPAVCLFHFPFVTRVILPFMWAAGARGR